MVTSPYELKILKWDEKLQANKQTNKQDLSEGTNIFNPVTLTFKKKNL